ncbi:Hypothetical protein MALK_5250 [Metamycoplasma alkalescens 14918]|uniref:Uncharacterized protein n=1 Tax=Metamycoplasma alkalescens 14918 TaxID=1188234 RepID=N9U9Y4_9BACT|nr:Hypothetical protein MALK_5250 [Metamycoplasma alkalescens 14918]
MFNLKKIKFFTSNKFLKWYQIINFLDSLKNSNKLIKVSLTTDILQNLYIYFLLFSLKKYFQVIRNVNKTKR